MMPPRGGEIGSDGIVNGFKGRRVRTRDGNPFVVHRRMRELRRLPIGMVFRVVRVMTRGTGMKIDYVPYVRFDH